jgi:MFS family permease
MTKQSAYAAAGRCLAAMVPWLICGLAALFYSYEYLLRVMPSVMEPELRTTYQLDASGFGALAAIYYIAYTPMQLFVGILMDRFGPRRLLAVSCLFCAIGTYLFAATEILSIAQTGRFLIGFGSAFAFVGVLKLASIWLPANRFALISGLTTTLGMAGAMFGDIVLTGIVHQIGWQELSVIAALVGVILAAVIFIFVRDRKATNQDKAQLQHTVSTYELTQGLLQLLKKTANVVRWDHWLLPILICCSICRALGYSLLRKWCRLNWSASRTCDFISIFRLDHRQSNHGILIRHHTKTPTFTDARQPIYSNAHGNLTLLRPQLITRSHFTFAI